LNHDVKIQAGKRVLVTRPSHQQLPFLERCQQAGFETLSLPCIDILPVKSDLSQQDIDRAELIVFTSRNAVDFANTLVPFPWVNANVYAIGRATERALAKFNQSLVASPIAPFNSEAFLDWYATQSPVSEALVIKGMAGREVIQTGLSQAGANVVVKDVYKRVTPTISDAERQRVFQDFPPNVISVTSDDVLRNLVNIAGPEYAQVLHATPLVVNSERCAEMAYRLGFDHAAAVACPPGDEGQLTAIHDVFESLPS